MSAATQFFYKRLHLRPPEPRIFENRSNLVSNCRASNRKFLTTFEPQIRNSQQQQLETQLENGVAYKKNLCIGEYGGL